MMAASKEYPGVELWQHPVVVQIADIMIDRQEEQTRQNRELKSLVSKENSYPQPSIECSQFRIPSLKTCMNTMIMLPSPCTGPGSYILKSPETLDVGRPVLGRGRQPG